MTTPIPQGWEKAKCPIKNYFCALKCVEGKLEGKYECRGINRCEYRHRLEEMNETRLRSLPIRLQPRV